MLFRGFLHHSTEDKIYPLKNVGGRLFLLSVVPILLGILRAIQSCCLEHARAQMSADSGNPLSACIDCFAQYICNTEETSLKIKSSTNTPSLDPAPVQSSSTFLLASIEPGFPPWCYSRAFTMPSELSYSSSL